MRRLIAASFAELERTYPVTAELLTATLKEYVRSGWAISAKTVIGIVKRTALTPEQLKALISLAEAGAGIQKIVCNSAAARAREVGEYEEVVRHLKSYPAPGQEVIVKIAGKEYKTVIDERGVQRFSKDPLLYHLVDSRMIDLNKLCIAYQEGKFSQEDYLRFYMSIGYSVDGFQDLPFFEDLEVENPLDEI